MSPKNNLDKRQPVGDSPVPDMSTISKGEVEESGKTVEKLHDLLRVSGGSVLGV